MKKVKLLILLFLLCFANAFAQNKIVYFHENQLTADKNNATAYGIFGKLSDQELWILKKYDLSGNLTLTGSYKDEKLLEPHGKFVFYASVYDYNYKNGTEFKIRGTDRFNSQVGEYTDGMQVGTWYYYYPNGAVKAYFKYKDGELNGEARGFNVKGGILHIGGYKNGLKEGAFYYFEDRFKEVYKNDALVSKKNLTRAEILALKYTDATELTVK